MSTDAQFWDGIAEKYAKKPVEDVPAYERKLELTKAKLKPTDIILDIGCGTGSLALELAPKVSHVHALDVSGEMIRIANRKAAAQNVSNVTFHQSAVEDISGFEAESFDVICAYNLLHLVEDRRQTLASIFKLLKPGGFFISSNVCLAGSLVPYGAIIAVMRWFGKAPLVEMVSPETALEEIKQAGFNEVSTPDVGAKNTVRFVLASKPRTMHQTS